MSSLARIAFVVVAAVFGVMAGAPSAFADYVEVTRNAHVRQSSTRESTSLKIATIGDRFQLLDDGARRRGFYHIELGNGRTGWIYGNLVDRHAGEIDAAVSLGSDQVAVHFIDVDQGAAALVEFPCAAVLVDAGGRTQQSVDHLMDYLERFFARRPDLGRRIATVFITHTHIDHNRGLRRVAEAFDIGSYVHNGVLEGPGSPGANWMLTHENQSPDFRLQKRAVADMEVTNQGTNGLTNGLSPAWSLV